MTPEERWSRIEELHRRIDKSLKRVYQEVHAMREERRAFEQQRSDLSDSQRLALLNAASAVLQALGRPPEA